MHPLDLNRAELFVRARVRRAREALVGLRRLADEVREQREATRSAQELRDLARHFGPRTAGKRVLIVSLTAELQQLRLEILLAKTLELHGARVSILTSRGHRRAVRELRALGMRNLVFYDDYAPPKRRWAEAAAAAMASCRTVRDFKQLEWRGARVGRQALSTVVRARHEPRIDLADPSVRVSVESMVAHGMASFAAGERILDRVRPELVLMIERGYTGVGAIFDAALMRDIPVVQFHSAHRDDAFMLKRYTLSTRDVQPRSLSDRTWAQLEAEGFGEPQQRRLEAELRERETGRWFFSARIRHSTQPRTREEIRSRLGLDPDRKVAVLFSHVLWDASMFYGRDIFEDQGEWFSETVRLANEDPSVQWLVKLHPALYWKLRAEGVQSEPTELAIIREAVGALPAHMQLLLPDADVSSADLFQVVDAGVTIRGTVGIELPALGVPVVTAGTSDYSGRGFTVDAESREEYAENVRRIGSMERLSTEQVELARLYAYGIFCRRPWRFDSFAIDYLPVEHAADTFEHRVRFNVHSPEEVANAQDLGRFARWVLESDDEDFLEAAG